MAAEKPLFFTAKARSAPRFQCFSCSFFASFASLRFALIWRENFFSTLLVHVDGISSGVSKAGQFLPLIESGRLAREKSVPPLHGVGCRSLQ